MVTVTSWICVEPCDFRYKRRQLLIQSHQTMQRKSKLINFGPPNEKPIQIDWRHHQQLTKLDVRSTEMLLIIKSTWIEIIDKTITSIVFNHISFICYRTIRIETDSIEEKSNKLAHRYTMARITINEKV